MTLMVVARSQTAFELTRFVGGEAVALDLRGSPYKLFVRLSVEVIDGHCETQAYSYRLQAGANRDSWLIRWEYFRARPRPDYEYPLAHVHLNGRFADGRPIERLHVPTRRIPLELVIWHLAAEWGVESKSDDWQQVLDASIAGFDDRRTGH